MSVTSPITNGITTSLINGLTGNSSGGNFTPSGEWKTATLYTDEYEIPSGTSPFWDGISAITDGDDLTACLIEGIGSSGFSITAKIHGFNFNIPPGANITQIDIRVLAGLDVPGDNTLNAFLCGGDTSAEGPVYGTSVSENIPENKQLTTFENLQDNIVSVTPTIVNNSDFGCGLIATGWITAVSYYQMLIYRLDMRILYT